MSEAPYETLHVDGGCPVKLWTRGVPVESQAKQQLANTARMPFVFRHVAAMPDVHVRHRGDVPEDERHSRRVRELLLRL